MKKRDIWPYFQATNNTLRNPGCRDFHTWFRVSAQCPQRLAKVRCAAYPKIIFLKLSLVLHFLLICICFFLDDYFSAEVFFDAYFSA